MENSHAKGRYLIHGGTVTVKEVTETIRKKFPNHRMARLSFTSRPITSMLKLIMWAYRSGVTDYIRTSLGKCALAALQSVSFFPIPCWVTAKRLFIFSTARSSHRHNEGNRGSRNDLHGYTHEFMGCGLAFLCWCVLPGLIKLRLGVFCCYM